MPIEEILDKAKQEHAIHSEETIKKSHSSIVLKCFMGASPVILKCNLSSELIEAEVKAMISMEWASAAKIICYSDNYIISERIYPGNTLAELFPKQEKLSIKIFTDVARKILTTYSPTNGFNNITSLLSILDREPDSHVEIYGQINKAIILKDKLLSTASHAILLHGDLHHGNIIRNNLDWCFIDPKGVIGEPEYEVACFIRNPMDKIADMPDSLKVIEERIKIISQNLNLEKQRISSWVYVQSILSYLWAKEDDLDLRVYRNMIDLSDQLLF